MHSAHSLSRLRGFTLVELLVTVAVAAILMTLAVPSFKGVINRSNLSSAHNSLLSALHYARSEAVSRGTAVNVKSQGGWGEGWEVLAPAAGGAATVLRTYPALSSKYAIATDPAGLLELAFNTQGALKDPVCFKVAMAGDDTSAPPLHIQILPSGSMYSAPSC